MLETARILAVFGVLSTLTLIGLLQGVTPSEPDPQTRATRVEVKEDRSEEAKKLKVQIEKEKEKLSKQLREEYDKAFQKRMEEVAKLRDEVARQTEELKKQKESFDKKRTNSSEEARRLAELEEKIRAREAEAEKKARQSLEQEQKLTEFMKKAEEREKKLKDRESSLETLAQTVLRQQADLEAATQALGEEKQKDEADRKAREEKMVRLAEDLEKRQAEILREQAKMAEEQKALAQKQDENSQEWRKVKDAYKRLQAREAEIEKKLGEAKARAGDWEKIKAEWDRIAEEKKRLSEAHAVRENVARFVKTFDKERYAGRLSALMRGTALKTVESEFIPFEFFSATDEEAKNQLRLFGIKDVYLNLDTKKYVIVNDYTTGTFSLSGTWRPGEREGKFPNYSSVVLRRRITGFYKHTLRRALDRIGGSESSSYVFGLMTQVMMYEVYMHQKKVMGLLGIDKKSIVKFTFAPFRHDGQWRFKVIRVTVRTPVGISKERTVGNYTF
jgi:hypothetical protein